MSVDECAEILTLEVYSTLKHGSGNSFETVWKLFTVFFNSFP